LKNELKESITYFDFEKGKVEESLGRNFSVRITSFSTVLQGSSLRK